MTSINSTWQLKAGKQIDDEAFAGSGSYEELLRLNVGGLDQVRIRGSVATTTLTGLKVTKSAVDGGTHSDYLVDADLDTPSNVLPWTSKTSSGTSLYLTASGSSFEFVVDVSGLREIGIWVKAGGAGSVDFAVCAAE